MAITLDLKTLNLLAGEHTIQTMAMKNGKAISCLSTGVSYTSTGPAPTPGTLNKGDIITIDNNNYKVINIDNSNVLLMACNSYNCTWSQPYATSSINTALNSTYYNTLSQNLKSAIIPIELNISTYNRSSEFDNTANLVIYPNQINGAAAVYSYYKVSSASAGQTKIFLLDIDEIIEFFSPIKILTQTEVAKFYTGINYGSGSMDCRSLSGNTNSGDIWYFLNPGNWGALGRGPSDTQFPAFWVDITKVQYIKV